MSEPKKRRLSKRIKYFFINFLLEVVVFKGRFIPRKWFLAFFVFAVKFSFLFNSRSKSRAITNLRRAYPDKQEQEIVNMARQVYINQAKNSADFFSTFYVTKKEKFFDLVKVKGKENFDAAFKKGKGVLILTCHVGSWEFSAITIPMLGYPTTAVSKALKDERLNKKLVASRWRRGLKNLNRGKVYPQLIKALNDGDGLVIMIDQDTKVPGMFVDFYGIPAYTPVGAARLALDTDAAVVPMYMQRTDDGKHLFTIDPEIPLVRTDDREADLLTNTKNYSEVIEGYIKEYPTQWVWMHQRWKTRPEAS